MGKTSSQHLSIFLVYRNIARDDQNIYKSFYGTDRRKPNLLLIRAFVDPQAEEVKMGDQGSFVKMKNAGPVLPVNLECSAQRFCEIADHLDRLHNEFAMGNYLVATAAN